MRPLSRVQRSSTPAVTDIPRREAKGPAKADVFNLPSFRLGRVFGIPLEVNASWIVVFALVVGSLSFGYFPSEFPGRSVAVDLASGVLTALLFFASIIAHELSHSLVARSGGVRIEKVTLFLFGGVAQMQEEPRTPGREFVMAIAGPGMSLGLAAAFAGAAVLMASAGWSDVLWAPLEYLAVINLSVAIFNLLPGFPLDGGRVLRSILWKLTGDLLKATRWASRAGQFIGYSLLAGAMIGLANGNTQMLWLGLIGWFIANLAGGAYRNQVVLSSLEGLTARDVSTLGPMTIEGEMTVHEFVHGYLLSGAHTRYPVTQGGSLLGLITLDAVRALPPEKWVTTGVHAIADRDLPRIVVQASEPAHRLLERLSQDVPGALLVLSDGALIGIVTRADVMKALRH